MINLVNISDYISFNEEEHIYTRKADGQTLCGVTTMMKRMGLSPDYSGISEEVLNRAAERGHDIHLKCDLVDVLDAPCGTPEADAYLSMRKEKGLIPLTSEYLISDFDKIASFIDLVFTTEELQKENKVILADIKCTSSVHEEPLAWQLSIYKKLFEEQNPGIKVAGLMGVWLPKSQYGSPKMFDVNEITSSEVDRLLECFAKGLPFETSVSKDNSNVLLSVQNKLITVLQTIDMYKKMETELKERLLVAMAESNVKKWENDKIVVSRVLGGTSQRFDAVTFKKENPEMYNNYLKTTETKDSLRIKIK